MSFKNYIFCFVLTSITFSVKGQDMDCWDYKAYLHEQQVPDWFIEFFKGQKLDIIYKISDFINPFYLEGDFNGDEKIDIAVLIEEKKTTKRGIIICHGTTKMFYILGAGKTFGNGGDDFVWLDIWKVYRETKVGLGVSETETISLKGQAILVEKSESASAIIYWTGQNYKWYQQGD